jgi:cytochrome c oxidase cbb3-type subunit I/II
MFTLLAVVVVVIGGVVELIPTLTIKSNIPTIASVKPYTPLELQGRDLYIREGCNACHTQWIRPFRSETERYGEYSKAGEYVYDHPFLWGSKRTGPDLMRLGGKYPDSWHYHHMIDPRTMSPGSIMPPYAWLAEQQLDITTTEKKMSAMKTLGVPYSKEEIENANENLTNQADLIVQNLMKDGIKVSSDKEIIALIAYMQRLGPDIKKQNQASN